MKIKLNTLYAGPDRVVHPGQVTDFEDGKAKELITAGYATEAKAESAPAVETAESKLVVETAEATHAKKKK